jgi:hypothetical protein
LSAARWAAGRAPSLALQLAPRLVPSSLRKHKRGQADIIGGAAVAIIAIRMALGRRQWVRAIAATELIGLRMSNSGSRSHQIGQGLWQSAIRGCKRPHREYCGSQGRHDATDSTALGFEGRLMRSAVGKLIIVMLATVLIAQTCNAQVSGSSGSGGGRKGHQQKADKPTASAPKANDKAYNAALKSLPDKPFDPWRGAR